jgi:hypothetical protein
MILFTTKQHVLQKHHLTSSRTTAVVCSSKTRGTTFPVFLFLLFSFSLFRLQKICYIIYLVESKARYQLDRKWYPLNNLPQDLGPLASSAIQSINKKTIYQEYKW